MRRSAWIIPSLLVAWLVPLSGAALAQPAAGSLDDKQLLGMRLFNQSCRVCHTKPQMTSPMYGPELSQSSGGGRDDVMREVISNGTPRMPGFKYHFEPAQIEAIVAYLKTIPTPATPAAPAR
jgi:mono/diheme cytochrome c family protein